MNALELRLYLSPDGDDGGGDAGDDGGGDFGGSDAGGDSLPADSTPEPISFEHGATFMPPGADKAISWGENGPEGYVSQSEMTRMRQADSQQLQQAQAAIQRERQQMQQWQANMLAQAQQGRQNGQPANPMDKVYSEAEARGGWVHVNDMRAAQQASDQRMASLEQMIQDTGGTMRHLVAGQQQSVAAQTSINRQRATQELDNLANSIIEGSPVLQSADPVEARTMLNELFDSYRPAQGETRESFMAALTQLANTRVGSMVNLVQGHQKATRDTARRARIPGPSSNPPLTGDGKPILDSSDLSDALWKRFGGSGP